MSRQQVITLQFGGCGNNIGNEVWKRLIPQHNLDESGNLPDYIRSQTSNFFKQRKPSLSAGLPLVSEPGTCVYFDEYDENKFAARCLLIDLESTVVDDIMSSSTSAIYKMDNIICGCDGGNNSWKEGHYEEGLDMCEEIMDMTRMEIEKCDMFQGVQYHACLDGAAAGLMCLIALKLRDDYPDKLTECFGVLPSLVTQPRTENVSMTMHHLLENVDMVHMIENPQILSILQNKLGQSEFDIDFAMYNGLIAGLCDDITSLYRSIYTPNFDMRKVATNLIPFPRMHFFAASHSPLLLDDNHNHNNNSNYNNYNHETVDEEKEIEIANTLLTQLWNGESFFANIEAPKYSLFAALQFSRGPTLRIFDLETKASELQNKFAATKQFAKWVPDAVVSTSMMQHTINAKQNMGDSCSLIVNHGGMMTVLTQIIDKMEKFNNMDAVGNIQDEELKESYKNVRDLYTEYQDKQDAVVDYDEDEDDDDEEDEEDEDEEDIW